MLTIDGCRRRLQRLQAFMAEHAIETALITDHKNVYYFSGMLTAWHEQAALLVDAENSVLICPNAPESTAAGDVRTFEAAALATFHPDRSERMAETLRDLIPAEGLLATELASSNGWILSMVETEILDLEEVVLEMRRCKDDDEIALLKKSAECIDACYAHAREVIEPGLDEVELFSQLQQVAVRTAGEPIGRFGNDFQCATPGGPPRRRSAEDGELWILDIAVEYRGYAADTCRVFAVGSNITDEQKAAFDLVADVLKEAESQVRPGVSCKAIYEEAKARLDAHTPGGFFHHLGHGLGLFAHEAPHVNPNWDEQFEIGDVFTLEPGLYHESLRGGIRLENNYLVTADGVEHINHAPLEMM